MSGALCHYGMAGEEQARLERSKRDGCAEHGIDRFPEGLASDRFRRRIPPPERPPGEAKSFAG